MFVFKEEANILHADLDSFFASVEQRDDPRLLGRPVIVGAGVVLAASLRGEGVRGQDGDAGAEGAAAVPARDRRARRASRPTRRRRKEVFTIFDDTAPVVEGMSIDEAFIDVRGMRRIAGAPVEIAARLRARVRDEVGLPITVGVARTKFLAKVARAVAKPDGLLLVEPARRARVPAPAAGREAVGRGGQDRGQAARARDHHGGGGRRRCPELALVGMLGQGVGAAAARAGEQARPAAR